MMKNEYRSEVDNLRLSEQFKEDLKKKMLAEYNKNGGVPVENDKPITVSRSSKIYRFAGIAACIILAVSTLSVLSVKNIKRTDSAADVKDNGLAATQEPGEANQADQPETEKYNYPAILSEEEEYPVGEDADNGTEEYEPKDGINDEEIPVVAEDGSEREKTAENEMIPESDNNPCTDIPEDERDNTERSEYASPNYRGDYNGDDYINSASGTPEGKPETYVIGEIRSGRVLITAPEPPAEEPEPETGSETVSEPAAPIPEPSVPDNSNASESVPDENTEESPTETPAEAPVDAPEETDSVPVEEDADEAPAEAPREAPEEIQEDEMLDEEPETEPVENPETESEEVLSEAEYEEDAALESDIAVPESDAEEEVYDENPAGIFGDEERIFTGYYDYRDDKLQGVAMPSSVVRFNIEKAYAEEELPYVAAGMYIDPSSETVYKIRITYDYMRSEPENAETLMINVGTVYTQLSGRPAMEGEYIARVITDPDINCGVVNLDENLIYKIYNVNGVDIAYHLISDSNENIDPGDTNMGLTPSESAVYTTSSNNPETYVHKAAVNELTRYLKRNLSKLSFAPIDYSSLAAAPSSGLRATYQSDGPEIILAGGSEDENAPVTQEGIRTYLESIGAEIGEKTCSIIAKNGNKARFENGVLESVTVVSPDSPLDISVRNIRVGDKISEVFKKLIIDSSDLSLESDAKITVAAGESDPEVVISLKDYKVKEIKITYPGVETDGEDS